MLDQQVAKQSPEIRGRAYLGDPSQPAADLEIQIWHTSDMRIFRRVCTDAEGRFRSNALPPGDYFVVAPLVGEHNFLHTTTIQGAIATTYAYLVQSEPLYLYADDEAAEVSLNVKLKYGQVRVEFCHQSLT